MVDCYYYNLVFISDLCYFKVFVGGVVYLDKDLFYTCMFLTEKCKIQMIPIHIKNNWSLGNLYREF